MKKILCIIIAIVTAFAGIVSIGACKVNEGTKFEIKYETDGNGTIQSVAIQSLKSGEQTLEVVAVPNEGYSLKNGLMTTRKKTVRTQSKTVI